MDGLVVLDDIPAKEGPLEWSPIPLEKAKTVGTLAAWLTLPWKNPDQIILPGFHTPAETSLRTARQKPGRRFVRDLDGPHGHRRANDLAQPLATLAGKRRSIWCANLCKSCPFSPADEAWQRAVPLVSQSPLDPAARTAAETQSRCRRRLTPNIHSCGPATCWSIAA